MFLPLRVQSCFSILDSTIRPQALAAAAAERGYPAVALTDRGNLAAAMAFSSACLAHGVQPILGVLLPVRRLAPAAAPRPVRGGDEGIVLLAQNETGWRNLVRLVSAAHLEGPGPIDRLEGLTDGLLALTGGADGALTRLLADGQEAEADRWLEALVRLFPDRLFVEVARTGDPVEEAAEPGLVARAHRLGLPLVATNPARFLSPDGWQAHDVMLCIADGTYLEQEERRRSNPRHALPQPGELEARFADLPEAIANCALVARRTAFALSKREPMLPRLAADAAAERAELERLARAGLDRRLEGKACERAPYEARLAYELDVIGNMGFAGYFLIVADFIGWARTQGIPVGPGRGSGAGSLVAYALGITDLDPLELGLLFERFLNPERRSLPDFDVDFCETRRDEVIEFVRHRYRADRVAHIATFGTLKARAVVKDVGRVLQMSYGEVDRLSKLIPAQPADPWDLDRALAGVPELQAATQADPRVARLMAIARQLEGLPRHVSTHAAGVVIADRPLAELVPLFRDPRSGHPLTQFDLKAVEDAGLVKFDFLGLKTLSIIDRAVRLLARRGVAVDVARLPLDDAETYALLARGDTVGVFQLESDGMRRALAQVKPSQFEDLVALGALYRPGPMDNIPLYAARKHGREPVDCLHPMLEPILKPTYGIIIYQEQVMEIARVMAGYTLGEADLLRRAMGKKIKAEMDAQESRFVDGAVARGVPRDRARHIFGLVEKFAGYGFNRSHAAAYALVAYQTAWLKAHHPAAFLAASMAFDMDDTDRLMVLVAEARRLGVPVLGPCVNESDADFALADTPDGIAIRYALGALKGVGRGAMEALVAERARGGTFRSLADWAARVDPQALNRRQLEALAAAGAFDALEPHRARVHAGAEALLRAAQRAAEERATGQCGLFGHGGEAAALPLPDVGPWRPGERLAREREAFGFHFSGHPTQAFAAVLEAHGCVPSAQALARRASDGTRQTVRLAGIVEDWRWRNRANRGAEGRFLLADLSDGSGAFSATCFEAEAIASLQAAAAAGVPLLLQAELDFRGPDEPPRIWLVRADPLPEVARSTRLRLDVRLASVAGLDRLLERLGALPAGGRMEVVLEVPAGPSVACLCLGRDFAYAEGLAADLAGLPGVASAAVRPVADLARRAA